MKALLLVLLLGAAPLAAAADLAGTWFNAAEGVSAELRKDGTAVVDGEPGRWSVKGSILRFEGAEGPLDYRFSLKGATLTLTSEDGERLVYERKGKAGKAVKGPAAKAVPRAKPKERAAGASQNHLLRGLLCAYSGGSTMSRSERVSFDGQGRYSTGSESVYSASGNDQYGNEAWRGGGHSNSAGEGGTYEVLGDTVVLTDAEGGRLEVQVNMRQADGRITELMHGKKLYAAGLCE